MVSPLRAAGTWRAQARRYPCALSHVLSSHACRPLTRLPLCSQLVWRLEARAAIEHGQGQWQVASRSC